MKISVYLCCLAILLTSRIHSNENSTNSADDYVLAKNFQNQGNDAEALKIFEKCLEAAKTEDEIYTAHMEIGKTLTRMKSPINTIERHYELAFAMRPDRMEPLYYLGCEYKNLNDHDTAYRIFKVGENIAKPGSGPQIEDWIYNYALAFELSISAYWINQFQECERLCKKVLRTPDVPQNYLDATIRNNQFAVIKIIQNKK